MGDSKLQVSESLPRAFTSEENEKYFLMAKDGDLSALDKIKEHNLRLVIRIINDNFFHVEGFDELANRHLHLQILKHIAHKIGKQHQC